MTQESIRRIILEWVTNTATTNASIAEINKLDAAFNKSIEGLGQLNNYQLTEMRQQFAASTEAVQALQAGFGQSSEKAGLLNDELGTSIGFLRDLEKIQADEAAQQSQITEQLNAQLPIHQRLAQAAEARLNAETGFMQQLRDEANATPAAGGSGAGGVDDGGGGDSGGNSLSVNRRALTSLGSLLGNELGGGALSASARLITVISAFGLLGGIAGVVGIALNAVIGAEQQRAKAAQDAADKLNQLAGDAAQGATTEGINKQIESEKQHQAVLQDSQTQIQGYLDRLNLIKKTYSEGIISADEYQAQMTALGNEVNQATGSTIGAKGGFLDLQKVLDDNQTNIDASNQKLAGLGLEAQTSAVKLNDAAAASANRSKLLQLEIDTQTAADSLTDQQRQAKIDGIQREIEANQSLIDSGQLDADTTTALKEKIAELEAQQRGYGDSVTTTAQQLADLQAQQKAALDHANVVASAELEGDQLTSEARQKRVDELNREITVYENAAQTSGLSSDAIAELNQKVADLKSTRDIIGSIADSFADAEQRAQNLKDQTDKLLDAEKILGDATDKLNKAQRDSIDAEDEHEDKLNTIREQANTKEQADAVKRDDDIADVRTKSAKKLTEDLATIETQSDKRIKQLKEQGLLTIEKLIANNDQAAAIDALEAQALQIKQEKENTADAETAKKKEIADSLESQVETIRQRYADQVTAAEAAAKQAEAVENERYNKQSLNLQVALAQAERDAQNGADAVNAIQKAMIDNGVFQEQYWANTRLSIVESNLQRIAQSFASHLASIGGLSGFSGGSTGGGALSNAAYNVGSALGSLINPSSASSVANSLAAFYASYKGNTSAHAFDTGGTVTSPGFSWLGVVGEKYSIPWAGKSQDGGASSGGGGDVHVHVYPSPGMDANQVAGLVIQKIKEVRPGIVQDAAQGVADMQRKARREAQRGS